MKKIWSILFVLMIVLLAGCTNEEENQGETDQEEQEMEQTEEPEVDNTEEQEETNNDADDQTESEDSTDENKEATDEEQPEQEVVQEEETVEPQYELNTTNWSLEPIGDAPENVVLLTIDDVPDKYALEMAKTLESLDAPAIFFVNGHFLETDEQKEMLKEIHEMGFPIGNHTYTHQKLDDVSEDKQKEEILSLSEKIEEIIGEKPVFFRAPHGVNTDFARQLVQDEGMLLMNWTYGYDYFTPYMDAEKLTEAMVTGEGPEVDVPYSLLKPGANLLMHDREWTNEALEDIVKGLRENGYEMLDPALIKTTK
ncbi:polysaccharide deacetylase family protein [Aquibacillus koreensis]|uniref:Polysaccharide deacetylase family protein n=1 Tax=Aquibacillus koreensis TaxID=279446 RepID=A0A9X3WL68_9BACI|nr:polysaccharide deacetylase family protein [Aquibacillus koreensis]MCT2538110.1 polysaccharide deacetylase family protein [Aquibacillus koreensis]MDC3420633.1 polysaccharide deacetylase family protein [Aquibacillus koreensis]